MTKSRADVSVVVVAFNALPWIEQALGSVPGYETVVVDNGSTDGTLELVRERFPEARIVEQGNAGMGGGNNAGMRVASGRYFLLLNPDAWVVGDAVERLVEFADAHPDAAIVAPRLLNTDGTLQRSVRGFPTLWRVATEYFFLRKLGPRTRTLNAMYAAEFDHHEAREAEWIAGPCLLVRRAAVDAVGLFDEDFFMFSEETDWCYRFHRGGWKVWFFPGAEAVHVGSASHGGRLYKENLRSHLRFFAKHYGLREAKRLRRLFLWSLLLRGAIFRGERGRQYRQARRWLRSGTVPALLSEPR